MDYNFEAEYELGDDEDVYFMFEGFDFFGSIWRTLNKDFHATILFIGGEKQKSKVILDGHIPEEWEMSCT